MTDVTLLLGLFAVLWYGWDNLRAKEVARTLGRQACEATNVQFLDDTVAKKKSWLRRTVRGRIQLCRLYFFEYADASGSRHRGHIVLLGRRPSEVAMDTHHDVNV